jgi:hypothetical protein
MRLFKNRVLRRNETIGDWRKLRNEELHSLYFQSYINKMIKSRRMRWAGYVAPIRKKRGAYGIFLGKPQRKRSLGRARRGWEYYDGY